MGNYVDPGDITSWPSGTTEDEKTNAIKFAEELIEKIIGRHFYAKPFDMELNGNGKNRIFPPLYADILTVTKVYVCGVELDPSWVAWDENSVYLNLYQSGAYSGSPELYYRIGEAAEEGIFPRGYNNVRVVGTYGSAAVPQPIAEAAKNLVDAINEGKFPTQAKTFKSEHIGRYSYTTGLSYAKEGIYTGIPAVDAILRHYVKQKKPIVMTP